MTDSCPLELRLRDWLMNLGEGTVVGLINSWVTVMLSMRIIHFRPFLAD